jgi:glycosyltransferase involved in cell wall biosynthesis
MPVFNTAQYIRQALTSVQGQQFDDFELVVVNDGSTDACSEILNGFARHEPRMRLIERPNRGLICTRNELLGEARGELVVWMDSDDVSHPNRFDRQVAAFDADPGLVCVGTNVQLVDPYGLSLGVEEFSQDDAAIRSEQLRGAGFRFPSTMQRRSVALAAGGFRHPFQIGEDLDFLLRVAERGRVTNLPDFLYVYRQHLLNTCTTMGIYWPEYRSVILQLAEERRKFGTDSLQRGQEIGLPLFNPVEARKLVPVVLVNWAREALAAGDRSRAFRYVLRSIRISPLQQAAWRQLVKMLLPL